MTQHGLQQLAGIVGGLALMAIIVTSCSSRPVGGMEEELSAAQPPALELPSPTQQIIIKYHRQMQETGSVAPASAAQMETVRTATGVALTYYREMSGQAHVLRLPAPLPAVEVAAIAAQLAALPEVAYAEPDRIMFPAMVPDDPLYGSQWHYFEAYSIQLPAAWDITTGSASVRIAVLDTGITEHADLAGRWVGGYDFVSDVNRANDGNGRDPDPHDPGDWVAANECFTGSLLRYSSWHGTHIAGTIGAVSNNGSGVTGINWVSPIVPVRVVGKCGGFISDIADGMRWAAGLPVSGVPANPFPAKVLNVSLGGPGVCSETYQNAINAINAAGSIIVVAAGNNSSNLNTTTYQPANCSGVLTVAATDRGGDRALYSNYGAAVKISAPGGENIPVAQNGILSTSNAGLTAPAADSYSYNQGTSMAAPHVSGVISLMVSLNPTLNVTQTIALLQDTTRPFPPGSSCTALTCGSGIVDAAAALATFPMPTPTPSTTVTATPSSTPTSTITQSATATLTPNSTATSTITPSATATLTPNSTATSTITQSATATPTPSSTATSTITPSATATPTPSSTATSTITPSATATPTASSTATNTATVTPTLLPTASSTVTQTPSATTTPPFSATATQTATTMSTSSPTPSPPSTATSTGTPTKIPISTSSPTPSATASPTAVVTPTSTPLPQATLTPDNPPASSEFYIFLPVVGK